MKCDCLNDCGDDPALRTGEAELCDHAKKLMAQRKAAQEHKLRSFMKLADAYANACAEPNAYTPETSKKQAREALKAEIKKLTHG